MLDSIFRIWHLVNLVYAIDKNTLVYAKCFHFIQSEFATVEQVRTQSYCRNHVNCYRRPIYGEKER